MNDTASAATLHQLVSPLLWHTGFERHGFKDFEEGLRSGKSCVSCKDQYLSHPHARIVVYQQAWYACLSSKHGFQVNLPSWVNFPDFERVGWLNSVMGKFLPNTFVKSATAPHTAEPSKTPTCCHVCETTTCTRTADMASVFTFWGSNSGHNLFLTVHSKQSCLADMLITPSSYAHSLQIGCV